MKKRSRDGREAETAEPDEYNSYLTAIFGCVKAGDIEAIVEYMKWAAGDNMGLIFDEGKARKAAERMLDRKDFIENPD